MRVIGGYYPLVMLSVCSVNMVYRSWAANMQNNSLCKLSLATPPLPIQSGAQSPIATIPTEMADDSNGIFQSRSTIIIGKQNPFRLIA